MQQVSKRLGLVRTHLLAVKVRQAASDVQCNEVPVLIPAQKARAGIVIRQCCSQIPSWHVLHHHHHLHRHTFLLVSWHTLTCWRILATSRSKVETGRCPNDDLEQYGYVPMETVGYGRLSLSRYLRAAQALQPWRRDTTRVTKGYNWPSRRAGDST